jgi:hypothetical protein
MTQPILLLTCCKQADLYNICQNPREKVPMGSKSHSSPSLALTPLQADVYDRPSAPYVKIRGKRTPREMGSKSHGSPSLALAPCKPMPTIDPPYHNIHIQCRFIM